MFRKRDMVLFIVLLVAGVVAVLFFLVHPSLQSVRDTMFFAIILKMIPTGLLLYFAWIAKSKPPRMGQIIMTLMATLFWQGFLLSSKRLILLQMTAFVILGIGYLLYLNLLQRKNSKPLAYATALFSVTLLTAMRYYTFLDGKEHYWIFSLIVALLAGIVSFYLVLRGWIQLDDDTALEKICLCLIVVGAVFVLSWSTANNMNYFLDFSQPEEYHMTIVHKETSSSRAGTYYEVVLMHNEKEITLNVSQSTYYQYEIGDSFPVDLYQGFFENPYFIAKGTA